MSRRRQKASSYFPPCDQCLCRKVRCDKSLPSCQRCFGANLTCTRDIVRRRPGRKKGSGLVIARLRTNTASEDQPWTSSVRTREQPQTSETEVPAVDQIDRQPRHSSEAQSRSGSAVLNGFALQPSNGGEYFMIEPGPPRIALPQRIHHDSPTNRPTTSTERTMAIIANIPNMIQYVNWFFAELYPIWPIMPESSFRESLNHLEDLDLHQTCLLLSICALTALHIPGPTSTASEPRRLIAQRLIEQCLQIRTTFDYI
jgi:hypothetical protein